MESKKAQFLNKYLLTCIQAFHDLSFQEPLKKYKINGELVNFKALDFENYYEDFLKELEIVILETNDIYMVHDYVDSCLKNVIIWSGFNNDQNKTIFSNGNEINYLIELKQNIEKYSKRIKLIREIDNDGFPQGLVDIYNTAIQFFQKEGETKDLSPTPFIEDVDYKPLFDSRFDFEIIRSECEELRKIQEKIIFIHDRVYHFKQWELQYDIDDGYGYRFSPAYYPNFEKLCRIELDRLEKRLELEKKLNIPILKDPEQKQIIKEAILTRYNWNASDTDLLELTTALFMNKSVTRKDGKRMTQIQLKESFESMFGIEIKGTKGKLQNAVSRTKSKTPFLDSLKTAFEDYSKERTD